MKTKLLILLFSIIISATLFSVFIRDERTNIKEYPSDWFLLQRAYPFEQINYAARDQAVQQFLGKREAAAQTQRSFGWNFEGPVNIGGRISAVAMHSGDMQTIYAGAASGGIFKSEDQGASWDPVFDDAESLSIGDIAIAPSDPQVIYVGTGEANAGGGSQTYDGFGIYKSIDAGESWQHLGLEESGSIGRLVVHPENPDVVYVAAMGRLYANNSQRGIYRSIDGGTSWEQVLFLTDSTGAIDVVIHPENPDTLYAAMWERVRTPDKRTYGGSTCGIYRSYDGGDTWTELANGLPSPSPDVGRIGLDISRSDPNILYAIYADKTGYFDGVYKTSDHGDSWTRTNDNALNNVYSSYGWWFGRISIDPVDPDIAFVIGFDLYQTLNGGDSWGFVSNNVHVDQHDMVVHPQNNSFAVLGNDGGVYLSYNGGSSWQHLENLPITQFYACEVDYQHPERFYGGTQDNGTNRTMTGSTDDWNSIFWGDGFYVLVDPEDNDYVYAEYQYGNFARSTNGGSSFYSAMNGISNGDRKNWNTPFVFDPDDPSILYYGANRLYKTVNRAQSWMAISPDLTDGPGSFNQTYGTITTIAVAPSNSNFIYVGTDDGNVWVSENGGNDWNNVSSTLPDRWVTRVAVDPYQPSIAYVTLSGYKYDSYMPHVFRTGTSGATWEDISGDLPEAPVNDIIIDPDYDSTLYLATDFGVYVTWSLGQSWQLLGSNLPNTPVTDLTLHAPTRKLVAATYGRSMYSFALDQLVNIPGNEDIFTEEISVYPNPASNYVTIELPENIDKGNLTLTSISGQVVHEIIIPGKKMTIDVQGFDPGVYLIYIAGEAGQHYEKKVVKK